MTNTLSLFKKVRSKVMHWWDRFRPGRNQRECDALYRLLYQLVHDKENSVRLSSLQTQEAFSNQWKEIPKGNALLSDPWFKTNVVKILCEEELLLKPEWFKNKKVLDAGCGNGRWSYALSQLGVDLTAVDINASALEATKEAVQAFNNPKRFVQSPLESLSEEQVPLHSYDLVFSWGVVHHCHSFNQSLTQLMNRVKDGGVLYLYLYGRESIPFDDDVALFKERVLYNTLPTWNDKLEFLMTKSGGDKAKVHINHDIYAPLINRRLTFDEVEEVLNRNGFSNIMRTIDHTELFIRAVKGPKNIDEKWLLPPKSKPYWFQRY